MRKARTSDGYTFYEQPDGRWTDTRDGNPESTDMTWDSLDQIQEQDPDTVVRDAEEPFEGT